MTDHWKDVNDAVNEVEEGGDWPPTLADRLRDSIDAAREEDADAHAAALTAKDAEIAQLRALVQQWRDHIDRSAEIENVADLYRRDPLAMADAIVRLREDVGALRAEKD